MARRWLRSRTNALLGGVCGGIAETFDVDANLVRFLFLLFAVLSAFGVLLYVALWLILPEADGERRDLSDRVQDAADEIADRARTFGREVRSAVRPSERGTLFLVGVALILAGTAFLLRNLGVVWMRWFSLGTLWPIFPVLIGVALLWRWLRGGS